MLRKIECQKNALSNDLIMVVAISETYSLRIHFDIVSTKVFNLNCSILFTNMYRLTRSSEIKHMGLERQHTVVSFVQRVPQNQKIKPKF